MRLETLGAVAALAAAVLTVEQRGAASTFGLVLSYALSITMLTSMTVRSACGCNSSSAVGIRLQNLHFSNHLLQHYATLQISPPGGLWCRTAQHTAVAMPFVFLVALGQPWCLCRWFES